MDAVAVKCIACLGECESQHTDHHICAVPGPSVDLKNIDHLKQKNSRTVENIKTVKEILSEDITAPVSHEEERLLVLCTMMK